VPFAWRLLRDGHDVLRSHLQLPYPHLTAFGASAGCFSWLQTVCCPDS